MTREELIAAWQHMSAADRATLIAEMVMNWHLEDGFWLNEDNFPMFNAGTYDPVNHVPHAWEVHKLFALDSELRDSYNRKLQSCIAGILPGQPKRKGIITSLDMEPEHMCLAALLTVVEVEETGGVS